ncbi:MAG: type II toxin-antitoxin system Phd/YefM family antitoxin [Burkholderiaceae bacterium]
MRATKVGIREFRSGLADFIAAAHPVAITRHGQTVAYLIPAPPSQEADSSASQGGVVDIKVVPSEPKAAKASKLPARAGASKAAAKQVKQRRKHG